MNLTSLPELVYITMSYKVFTCSKCGSEMVERTAKTGRTKRTYYGAILAILSDGGILNIAQLDI